MKPAIAGWAGPFVVAHPGQLVVAPFAGDSIRAGQRPAADDDAGTYPGAEDGGEYDTCTSRCAIGRLGDGETVGVIMQPHRTAKRAREIAIQRSADEPRGVGVLDEAGGRRDGAGYADADSVGGAEGLLQFGDERGNSGDLAVIVARGSGRPLAIQLAPIRRERDDLELRASEVDPDADRIRHFSPCISSSANPSEIHHNGTKNSKVTGRYRWCLPAAEPRRNVRERRVRRASRPLPLSPACAIRHASAATGWARWTTNG